MKLHTLGRCGVSTDHHVMTGLPEYRRSPQITADHHRSPQITTYHQITSRP